MTRKALLLIALLPTTLLCMGKGKAKHNDAARDQIDILANLPVDGGPVTRFTVTRHYSRTYLYVEHASRALTLVDITDANHPVVLSKVDLPAAEAGSILAAAGDAALITTAAPVQDAPRTTSMAIVSFADRGNPHTVKQFDHVTCTSVDEPRGLIFVANNDGLWILHRNPAEDPDLQERYAHEVLYNH